VKQEWVAQRVGLARSKISEIENGKYLPSWPVLDALIVALGMDRDRTVALWRAAEDGRRGRRHMERMGRHRRPASWVDLPRLPEEIRQLLRAQERMAEELPYRLPGARRLSLATVYVRQGLGSGTEDSESEPARPEPVVDERGYIYLPAEPRQRLTVRPPARPVQEALDEHAHLVVTGGPGQGKSAMSLRLSAQIAAAWATPDRNGRVPLVEPVIPLRLTARELASRLEMPFSQALAGSAHAMYGALLAADVGAHLLAGRVAGCRWMLLVDGLDEIADGDRRDRLVTALTRWAGDADDSPYRILLTTRPVDSAALVPLLRTAAHYELQPFDEAALTDFAGRWFDGQERGSAERFLRQIRQAYLDELVQVPLLATIAAIVFDQHSDRPLPDNQYSLYEAYLTYLRTGRCAIATRFDHLREGLLEHLGTVRLEHDTSLVAAAQDWVTRHGSLAEPPAGWREELITFLTAVGPLVSRGEDVQFLHHSFAEHLAATAKARQLPVAFDPACQDFARLLRAAEQGDRGRHARAVLLHYARLHPAEADRILAWLHRGSGGRHLLAARLLAHRLPASAKPVDAFLATARAWAITTQYSSGAILRQVSRAAHHPGLIPWLAELMRDHTMPWASRLEAATALATRLRGPHVGEATGMLRTVVQDEAVPIEHRLTAAESLAECTTAERQTAEHSLGILLAGPTIAADRRRHAAVVLAGLGPQARTRAVNVLTSSLDDPDAPVDEVIGAAAGLAAD
jgi:cellulose synthase operon protein C